MSSGVCSTYAGYIFSNDYVFYYYEYILLARFIDKTNMAVVRVIVSFDIAASEQRRQFLKTGRNNSDYPVVSLSRLSVGCGTTPRRQSGTIYGFRLVSA